MNGEDRHAAIGDGIKQGCPTNFGLSFPTAPSNTGAVNTDAV